MMRFLLIDTCGMEGSVALADASLSNALVAQEVLPGRSASERLLPVVKQMLAAAEWRLKDLAAIVVVHGPGSFTGVRVGLSAAKGLSEAGGVPLMAVSRLAVLAGAAHRDDGEVCAVLDAGRGEFYCGVYAGRRRMREALLTAEEVAEVAARSVAVVACEAKVAETLASLKPVVVREPQAVDALPFAVERVEAKEFDDVATLDANYLRRTDAEIFAKPVGIAK
ncbi:MAG: tRNA (adenosine(37)-N6)-threonylcarbamoyltransferase complex dimerization subunit type 1 TsaB [Acidobacteria bacterium]|nr:tRNA (adenosine(37)-N6)-threonylcarbamoyltransferase complex dimerization subunit type 1 TsaB [Acidobacteriota bacterium]